MKTRPQNGRVQVKPGTDSPLTLVGDQTTFRTGVIVAVDESLGAYRVGQMIAFNHLETVDLAGETLYFVPRESIIAVVER